MVGPRRRDARLGRDDPLQLRAAAGGVRGDRAGPGGRPVLRRVRQAPPERHASSGSSTSSRRSPRASRAAGDKCFYFQADHWRSAVVQDDGTTAIYEWDGRYYVRPRARARAARTSTNFKVNGRTEDPGKVPGMPPEYAQHMGPGTGGVVREERRRSRSSPRCVEKAKAGGVYAGRPARRRSSGRRATTAARPRSPTRASARSASATPRPACASGSGARTRSAAASCATAPTAATSWARQSDRSGDLGDRRRGADGDDPRPQGPLPPRPGHPGAERAQAAGAPARVARAGGSACAAPPRTARRRGKVRWVAVYDRRAIRTPAALRAMLRRALIG